MPRPRFRRPRSLAQLLRQVASAALACLALALALRPPPGIPGATGPPPVPVAVAAADLPAGTVLGLDDLATVSLPADAAPAGSATAPDQLTGQVLASPVRSGEPVTDARLVGPGLWSAVPAGLVASPVRLADLAVATLLRAGDRVDVLATTASTDDPAGSAAVVAEGALVLTVPTAPETVRTTADGGLLVLAVPPSTAQRLAAAGAAATLTVTLGRP